MFLHSSILKDKKLYCIRSGNLTDIKQICDLMHVLRPKMKVSENQYYDFLRYKKWYIFILELVKEDQIIGFDIRYEIDNETLCINENGVLLEYANLADIFRSKIECEVKNLGYKHTLFYIQSYAYRSILSFESVGSSIEGFQKNRWIEEVGSKYLPAHVIYYQTQANKDYKKDIQKCENVISVIEKNQSVTVFGISPKIKNYDLQNALEKRNIQSIVVPYHFLHLLKKYLRRFTLSGFFRKGKCTFVVLNEKLEEINEI